MRLAPVVHEVAQEKGTAVQVCRIDARANMASSVRYGITQIPQVLLFREGKEKSRAVGSVPKGKILQMLASP